MNKKWESIKIAGQYENMSREEAIQGSLPLRLPQDR